MVFVTTVQVNAPPGVLGFILEETNTHHLTISKINDYCVVKDQVVVGDTLIGVDDDYIHTLHDVVQLINSKRSNPVRKLTFQRRVVPVAVVSGEGAVSSVADNVNNNTTTTTTTTSSSRRISYSPTRTVPYDNNENQQQQVVSTTNNNIVDTVVELRKRQDPANTEQEGISCKKYTRGVKRHVSWCEKSKEYQQQKKKNKAAAAAALPSNNDNNNNDDDDDDDDVEVIDDPGIITKFSSSSEQQPVRCHDDDDDDDIIFEGVKNETRLPHLRHHCTTHPFTIGVHHDSNNRYCDLCYCYVCDCPVKDCQSWYCADSIGGSDIAHCHAHDKDFKFQRMKAATKRQQKQHQQRKYDAEAVSVTATVVTARTILRKPRLSSSSSTSSRRRHTPHTPTTPSITTTVVPPSKRSHARSQCPVCIFDPKLSNALGYYTFQTVVKNKKHCPSCYCYVCRCPAYLCKHWFSAGNRISKFNHCCSTTRTCSLPTSSTVVATTTPTTTLENNNPMGATTATTPLTTTSRRTDLVILLDSDDNDNKDAEEDDRSVALKIIEAGSRLRGMDAIQAVNMAELIANSSDTKFRTTTTLQLRIAIKKSYGPTASNSQEKSCAQQVTAFAAINAIRRRTSSSSSPIAAAMGATTATATIPASSIIATTPTTASSTLSCSTIVTLPSTTSTITATATSNTNRG